MIFCQACGASNTGDARFCNMCGGKIAQTGEPGGPVHAGAAKGGAGSTTPVAAPTTGSSTKTSTTGTTGTTMSGSSISLEAIGVRSPSKTYGILFGGGLLLFALGGVGMWLVMKPGEEAPVAEADTGTPDDAPIVIGDPVPAGEELPPDVDFVPGEPRAARTTKRTGRATTGGSTGGSTAGTGGGTTGGSTGGSTATGGSTGGSTAGTGGGTTGGSTATGGGATGGTGGTTAGTGGSVATGETGSGTTTGGGTSTGGTTTGSTATGSTGTRDWDAMEEEMLDEEDVAMENYSLHVRRVIREFYIARAQTCFDHETRTDGVSVRGTVVIGFTIEQSGEVVGTSVQRNTTGRETLGPCLARQVDQWRLPPPPPELEPVEMQMPFSR